MAKAKKTQAQKPFAVKGFRVVSPIGTSLWCKVKEPDYQYNAKGILSTTLVCDPELPQVQAFIEKLEALRDEAFLETKETLGAKGKGLKVKDVYTEHLTADGEETGLIEFKFQLKDVDDKDTLIKVVDSKKQIIKNIPLIGNGSVIRCIAYANPYYMASTKDVGISMIWEQMQLLKLEEWTSGADFDDDIDDEYSDGYVSGGDDFDDEDDDYTPVKPKKKSPPPPADDDDEEDEDEDDEDYTPPSKTTKPKTTSRKVVKKKVEDDVEDDDDSDF